MPGNNKLNMSQQNPLNNSKKLNVHQIRFNKDNQQRFASINHPRTNNNSSGVVGGHGPGLSAGGNNSEQKITQQIATSNLTLKNHFKGLNVS